MKRGLKRLSPSRYIFYTYRVAFSSLGSQAAASDVELAVVGRGDQVDEVDVAVRLEAVELGQQHAAPVLPLLLDLVGPVKLLLQHRADLQHKEGLSEKSKKRQIVSFIFKYDV